jgi:hypothetical protein
MTLAPRAISRALSGRTRTTVYEYPSQSRVKRGHTDFDVVCHRWTVFRKRGIVGFIPRLETVFSFEDANVSFWVLLLCRMK